MLEIDKQQFFFKKKNIWFSDALFDVPDVDVVHFYACRSPDETGEFECEESPTLSIDLTRDLETIWKGMDNSSCRYFIRRGEKEGVEVRLNEDYEEYHEIYEEFVAEKGFDTTVESVEFMREYGTLFTAAIDGEVLSGALMLEDEEHIRWLSGGSRLPEDGAWSSTQVSCCIRTSVWEAIQYAKDKGIKEFDLGGYWVDLPPDDPRNGVNFFKERFGGEIVTYYKCSKYYSKLFSMLRVLASVRS